MAVVASLLCRQLRPCNPLRFTSVPQWQHSWGSQRSIIIIIIIISIIIIIIIIISIIIIIIIIISIIIIIIIIIATPFSIYYASLPKMIGFLIHI